MAVNLNALSTATTAATALANLILVTPSKSNYYQAQAKIFTDGSIGDQDPKFLFDYEGENSITLDSDITDHFVEDNTAIQDQISLRPEMISTRGYVGELNDIVPPILEPLKIAADKLTVVGAYTPDLSVTALRIYNEASQAYALANLVKSAGVQAWSSLSGNGSSVQNKQQIAYGKFYGYWQNRTLFTLQTPWAIFDDMAIKSMRAIQDEETRMISSFEISFKKIRFASTQTTSDVQLSFQGRAKNQAAGLINNGVSSPKLTNLSLTDSISSITG